MAIKVCASFDERGEEEVEGVETVGEIIVGVEVEVVVDEGKAEGVDKGEGEEGRRDAGSRVSICMRSKLGVGVRGLDETDSGSGGGASEDGW